ATATAQGGTGGILFAGTIFVGVATIGSSVEAHMNGTVTSGSSLDVNATATNHAHADTLAVSISLLGAPAGAASIPRITPHSHVVADSGSTASISIGGGSTFEAMSTNLADGKADVGSGGGILALGVSIPTSTIAGATSAGYDGSVSGSSTGLTVKATGTNTAG